MWNRTAIICLAVVGIGLGLRSPAAGPTPFLNGRVVRVSDGDTVYVLADGDWVNIRLSGIDCPEKAWEDRWPAQPYSKEAKEFAEGMVLNKDVSVRLKEDETYGRSVG